MYPWNRRTRLARYMVAVGASASLMAQAPRGKLPVERPRIGLALEGGGALGLAHVGVYAWMLEHHVPVDRIAGTSMGAMVGALIASGHTPAEIQRLAEGKNFDEIFALRPSLSQLNFRRRQDRDELPQAITIGLRGGSVSMGNALIADDRLNVLLSRELLAYNTEALRFDDLPIPFRCVATNLYSDFVSEAAHRYAEARTSSDFHLDELVTLYALVSRIRLVSTDTVVTAADALVKTIVQLYGETNVTLEDFRKAALAAQVDPLHKFSAACRKDLQGLLKRSG